jgi:exodeoxyribonuclease VII large subunit
MSRDDDSRRVLTVSQLNEASRRLLEGALPSVWVEGEISNFQAASSGHWYFTLKDAGAQLRCAMFRGRNIRARLRPANGDSVLVRGGISLYAARGEYQMIAEELEAAGLGALQRALEALRLRLSGEGLFDEARKRPLPAFPAHLGVVSSLAGAALQDILTVLARRYPLLRITVFPVLVQGTDASRQIALAINSANALASTLEPPLDVLLVGRGGGSIEDLWAFNEEAVVRAIHASALPVVSAVGHETDFTLADFAADLRAPTPSAAAELISPDRDQLLALLGAQSLRLHQVTTRRLTRAAERVQWLSRRLRHPGARLREQAQRLDELEVRLRGGLRQQLRESERRLGAVRARLGVRNPAATLGDRERLLGQLQRRLQGAMRAALAQRRERLAASARLLDSVSPLATLDRGYAIVSDAAGAVMQDASTVSAGTRVLARLARGSLECEVIGALPQSV